MSFDPEDMGRRIAAAARTITMHASTAPEWPTGNRIEALEAEITALRIELINHRVAVLALVRSPPMASISLCCKIIRIGHWSEATMHDGTCRERHGGELGKTYYLHDVDALLSEGGEPRR